MTTLIIDRDEINDLKRLDIKAFLPSFGYHPDPADRYKKATFVRDGQTVKAFQTGAGYWIARDFDKGISLSVIDLAFEQVGSGRWREACDLLRGLINKPAPSETSPEKPASVPQSSPIDQPPAKIKKTEQEILAEYELGTAPWRSGDPVPAYLVGRDITVLDAKFHDSFRISSGASGNLHFPHRYITDQGKMVYGGIERRGPGLKGMYSDAGLNGIWLSGGGFPASGVIVIFESQINAMSYEILHPRDDGQLLMSIRAGTEHIAVDMIKRFIAMGKIKEVIIATDNDCAGMGYASKILGGLYIKKSDRHADSDAKYYGGARVYYRAPDLDLEDWNDVLRACADGA